MGLKITPEDIEERYSLLREALAEIADGKKAEVHPVAINVEGKEFTDYEVSKKGFLGLRRIPLLRAYFTYGFSGETGFYTDLMIAKSNEITEQELEPIVKTFSNLQNNKPVDVKFVDYKEAKKEGFWPYLYQSSPG